MLGKIRHKLNEHEMLTAYILTTLLAAFFLLAVYYYLKISKEQAVFWGNLKVANEKQT